MNKTRGMVLDGFEVIDKIRLMRVPYRRCVLKFRTDKKCES